MIKEPENWRKFGVAVTVEDIGIALKEIISGIDCINLSYSGGVDSSILLYYLLELKGKARLFTVANSVDHPDIQYSKEGAAYFRQKYNIAIEHTITIKKGLEGDDLVRAYYKWLGMFVTDIVVGDCIDELTCGYYGHQDLQEATYHDYLNRLQAEHLGPLNDNSGDIGVHIPYSDDRIANMIYRIPHYDKVTLDQRKIPIMQLAQGKVPDVIIERKKYGFATSISGVV